jgi:methyl-accepting chemotaxis protein
VVADEVRKLAERTTTATNEIADMINLIHTKTSGAVESIKAGSDEVNRGKELAGEAGESLKQIISSSAKVVDVTMQVASASEEQASAAEQISRSIDGINTVTQETAQGIHDIASSAEVLHNLTDNIKLLIDQFKLNVNYVKQSDDFGEKVHHEVLTKF